MIQSALRKLQASGVQRLLSRSAFYALGELLTKGARYITFPIFIAVLTVEEVGVLSIVQAVSMICWAIATLGFGAAVKRFYRDSDGVADETIVGRLWGIRLVLAAVPVSILAGVVYFVGDRYFSGIPLGWILLALLGGYLRAGTQIIEAWYIIREELVKYRAFTFLRFLTTTGLILLLVVMMKWGVYGAILGETIGAAVWCAIAGVIALAPYFRDRNAGAIEQPQSLKPILRYSLPVIPHAVFLWMLLSVDRVILQQHVAKQDIAVYEITYMLAFLLMIVASAINAVWLPDFFRTADKQHGPANYARTANIFFSCVLAGACAISLFAPDLIALFTGYRAEYSGAASLCRVLVIGTCCQSMFIAFSMPLLFTGRTGVLSLVSGLGVSLNVVFNLRLIPEIGTMGAAWATVIAYAGMCVAMLLIVHFAYRIPWNYTGLVMGMVGFVALALVQPTGEGSSFANLLLRLVIAIVVGGGMFVWFQFSHRFHVCRPAISESDLKEQSV